jgi:hypothetical protein
MGRGKVNSPSLAIFSIVSLLICYLQILVNLEALLLKLLKLFAN